MINKKGVFVVWESSCVCSRKTFVHWKCSQTSSFCAEKIAFWREKSERKCEYCRYWCCAGACWCSQHHPNQLPSLLHYFSSFNSKLWLSGPSNSNKFTENLQHQTCLKLPTQKFAPWPNMGTFSGKSKVSTYFSNMSCSKIVTDHRILETVFETSLLMRNFTFPKYMGRSRLTKKCWIPHISEGPTPNHNSTSFFFLSIFSSISTRYCSSFKVSWDQISSKISNKKAKGF